MLQNKLAFKDLRLKLADLETVLVPKQEISELDRVRHEYLSAVNTHIKQSKAAFAERDYVTSRGPLEDIVQMCQHAYDLDLLLQVLQLRALVAMFFDHHEEAIRDFKMMRRVADEVGDMHSKAVAYERMGQAYTLIREYHLALKSHKKQLECAWKANDTVAEIRAYELIGKAYYYLGEISKSKTYNERSTRGILEAKDSKIRIIFTSLSDVARQK